MAFLPTTNNALGIHFGKLDIEAFNETGGDISKGGAAELDVDLFTSRATDFVGGSPNNGLAVMRSISTSRNGIFAVALDDMASGKRGRWRLQGRVDMLVEDGDDPSTGQSTDAGFVIVPRAASTNWSSNNVSQTGSNRDKVVAYALGGTSGASAELVECLFNGITGWGGNVS